MEELLYTVIRCTDVLSLLGLATRDVLKLRLVSRRLNSAVKANERFWKAAFPGVSDTSDTSDVEEPSDYANHVIDICHARQLERRLKRARDAATDSAKAKNATKQRLRTREEKMNRLVREIDMVKEELMNKEAKHLKKRKLVKKLERELRDKGIKRQKLKTLREDTQFDRDKWGPPTQQSKLARVHQTTQTPRIMTSASS